MKEHIKRLINKFILWHNMFSEQVGFAEEALTTTGRCITGQDRSSYNHVHGMTPVYWQAKYQGEDVLHGNPKMLSKHFCGLWLGSRRAADNHALLKKNQVNCRISCFPEESRLKPAPTAASGQKDFLDLGAFDSNYYIGNICPNTSFPRDVLLCVKSWIKMIDERLQLGYDVLVACRQGVLRSFILFGCYLMVTKKRKRITNKHNQTQRQ